MITEQEIIEILENNILPQFRDIIGIFKDDWIDKRKPIFKKIAKVIIDKIKEGENKISVGELIKKLGMRGLTKKETEIIDNHLLKLYKKGG